MPYFSDLPVLVSVTLSPPFPLPPNIYNMFILILILMFLSLVDVSRITCLWVLTGNSFSIYVHTGRGWQNLSNDNFCENRMTGSIVALFVEWKVYERACERLIESLMKIELLNYVIPVISLKL